MKRVTLFAYPAWHSLSPAMQNSAFEATGVDAVYEAWEVPPDELTQYLDRLRGEEFLGANVTIPHKEAVLEHLDELSEDAEFVGAVNTIVRRGGELVGHNTDVVGFQRALLDLEVDVRSSRVLLLGAGGAGRAVAFALLSAGVKELLVHNRTYERAQRLAEDFEEMGTVQVVAADDLANVARTADLIINSTSVGLLRQGVELEESPLPEGALPERGAVMDLIYRPKVTRLLRDASASGLRIQNGLPMLIYQGAAAFFLWTGVDAPTAVMEEAVVRVLGE